MAYLRQQAEQWQAHRGGRQAELFEALVISLEEVRVAQEELWHQYEELLANRDILDEGRRLYRNLFDGAPDGYLVTDPHGVVRTANRAAAALLNVRQDRLAGKPMALFVAKDDRQSLRVQLAWMAYHGRVQDWTVPLLPKGGQPFPAAITLGAIRNTGGRDILGLRRSLKPIPARQRAEKAPHHAFADLTPFQQQRQCGKCSRPDSSEGTPTCHSMIGHNDALQHVLFRVAQVAPTGATVLILGEMGTGKELVARAMHDASPRAHRPLVTVHRAALLSTRVESELFGHEKGAFTSAQTAQLGRFKAAHGGTIFWDEIGELPQDLQVKLLRVLEDGTFERLGSPQMRTADVQVMAATDRDLAAEVRRGRFRHEGQP